MKSRYLDASKETAGCGILLVRYTSFLFFKITVQYTSIASNTFSITKWTLFFARVSMTYESPADELLFITRSEYYKISIIAYS